MEKFKQHMLSLSEILDSWRVIPRIMAGAYGFMVYKLFIWYTSMPTYEEKECDNSILQTLLDKGIDVQSAMEMACTVVGTVGGPTSQQTSFVTIIISLSTGIFGFYVNSGNNNKGFFYGKSNTVSMQPNNNSNKPIDPTKNTPPS
jgi:hypothetical protein